MCIQRSPEHFGYYWHVQEASSVMSIQKYNIGKRDKEISKYSSVTQAILFTHRKQIEGETRN